MKLLDSKTQITTNRATSGILGRSGKSPAGGFLVIGAAMTIEEIRAELEKLKADPPSGRDNPTVFTAKCVRMFELQVTLAELLIAQQKS